MKNIQYLYLSLPFFVSFFSAQGVLNNNHYVKLLGFVFVFLLMLILAFSSKLCSRTQGSNNINISMIDFLTIGLLLLYVFFQWGNSNILDHYYPIIYILFYLLLRLSIRYDNYWDMLTNISLFVISAHLIICGMQYLSILPNFNSYFKIGSTFGNPDMLAAYLVVLLPVCYKGRNMKLIRYSISFLTVILFFLLQARTAIVATAVILLIDLTLNYPYPKKYLLRGILVLITGIILLAYWNIDSFSGRVFIWLASASMILEKPLGWGLYSFEKHYPEFQAEFMVNHPKIADVLNVDIVHSSFNEFLNIGVTLGVIGLIFYIFIVFYVIKVAFTSKSPLLYPIIAFQIVSLSYFPFRIIPLTVIYILFCTILIAKEGKWNLSVNKHIGKAIYCTLISLVSLYSICGLYSFIQWENAVLYECKDSFKRAYVYLNGNGRYLTSYSEFMYRNADTIKSFELMIQAENYYSDIAFLNNLAILYEKNGKIIEAKKKYDLATKMAPDNANIALANILFLRRIGEESTAYKTALLWHDKLVKHNLRPQYRLAAKEIENYILYKSVVR